MTLGGNNIAITPLMCVGVAAILPPSHQALLRCAGSAGDDVYEELVARGKALMYIEYTRPNGDGTGAITYRVPTTLPLTQPRKSIKDTAVLVVTHEYLARTGKTLCQLEIGSAWSADALLYVHRLKYIGGGGEVEPGLPRFGIC